MTIEIERKFLVISPPWDPGTTIYQDMEQGYLSLDPRSTVRARTTRTPALSQGFITAKGLSRGAVRSEFEYAIPYEDACEMISQLCSVKLIKRRWFVMHAGHEWHVDEFLGDNQGLVVAEIELAHQDEGFDLPPWAGQEVTGDHRYANANLAINPYRFW